MTDDIRPHPFAFPQEAIDDLRDRLGRTRWPDKETVDDWSQGAPLGRMQALVDYWREGHDWRAAETRLNAMEPSSTTIDGLAIHFLHVRSPEPDAIPLVMTHGWPGSVFEFLEVARMLADPKAHGADVDIAFHVVLPSLPGFGLSEKPTRPGWTPERIGAAWVELMRRLGYERFVAQGGDWGYSIANVLGGIGAPAVAAVHFNMFPIFEGMEARDAQEEKALKRLKAFKENENGYMIEQTQSPQTVGYALTDSPAGLAAWFYEKYEMWTDHDGEPEQALSRDQMLDNITLYWLTNTAASSARIYWQSMTSFKEHTIDVPVGYSQFPRDIHETSRRWVEERYPTLVHYSEQPKGGHFAAWEQPDAFAREVRASFGKSDLR